MEKGDRVGPPGLFNQLARLPIFAQLSNHDRAAKRAA